MLPTDRHAAAHWLAAFGQPTRIAIIQLLAAGPRTVTDLATLTRAEAVTLSYHLKQLKAAGLAADTRDGRFRVYALAGGVSVDEGRGLEFAHPSGVKVVIPVA